MLQCLAKKDSPQTGNTLNKVFLYLIFHCISYQTRNGCCLKTCSTIFFYGPVWYFFEFLKMHSPNSYFFFFFEKADDNGIFCCFCIKTTTTKKQHEPQDTYQLLLLCLCSACHVLATQHHLPQTDDTHNS